MFCTRNVFAFSVVCKYLTITKNFSFDGVFIYNRPNQTDGPRLIAHYHGENADNDAYPRPTSTSGNYLLLRFISDVEVTRSGFNISYAISAGKTVQHFIVLN